MSNTHKWNIPERRVKKFVKMQLTEAATTKTTNSDDGSIGMSRMKGLFKGAKKLFGSPKKKADNKAPVNEIALDEAGEVRTEDEEELFSPTKAQPPVTSTVVPDSPEVTAETEAIDRDIASLPEEEIYKDDNDGSEKKCCEACEGCIVM